jgi:hypothetical protein
LLNKPIKNFVIVLLLRKSKEGMEYVTEREKV